MIFFKLQGGNVAGFDDPTQAPAGAIEITEEEYVAASIQQLSASDEIKQQILNLEAQQTDRRIREAALCIDNGWLANLNAQIAALRAQLTS